MSGGGGGGLCPRTIKAMFLENFDVFEIEFEQSIIGVCPRTGGFEGTTSGFPF